MNFFLIESTAEQKIFVLVRKLAFVNILQLNLTPTSFWPPLSFEYRKLLLSSETLNGLCWALAPLNSSNIEKSAYAYVSIIIHLFVYAWNFVLVF